MTDDDDDVLDWEIVILYDDGTWWMTGEVFDTVAAARVFAHFEVSGTWALVGRSAWVRTTARVTT